MQKFSVLPLRSGTWKCWQLEQDFYQDHYLDKVTGHCPGWQSMQELLIQFPKVSKFRIRMQTEAGYGHCDLGLHKNN